jgi:hypothetical protein
VTETADIQSEIRLVDLWIRAIYNDNLIGVVANRLLPGGSARRNDHSPQFSGSAAGNSIFRMRPPEYRNYRDGGSTAGAIRSAGVAPVPSPIGNLDAGSVAPVANT